MSGGGSQPGRIVVRIDPGLRDLVPEFLENRRREVPALQAAIERGDLASVQAAGHRLKGDGGGYGFDAISGIGGALEEAAKRGDREALRRAVRELAAFLERVEVVDEAQ